MEKFLKVKDLRKLRLWSAWLGRSLNSSMMNLLSDQLNQSWIPTLKTLHNSPCFSSEHKWPSKLDLRRSSIALHHLKYAASRNCWNIPLQVMLIQAGGLKWQQLQIMFTETNSIEVSCGPQHYLKLWKHETRSIISPFKHSVECWLGSLDGAFWFQLLISRLSVWIIRSSWFRLNAWIEWGGIDNELNFNLDWMSGGWKCLCKQFKCINIPTFSCPQSPNVVHIKLSIQMPLSKLLCNFESFSSLLAFSYEANYVTTFMSRTFLLSNLSPSCVMNLCHFIEISWNLSTLSASRFAPHFPNWNRNTSKNLFFVVSK